MGRRTPLARRFGPSAEPFGSVHNPRTWGQPVQVGLSKAAEPSSGPRVFVKKTAFCWPGKVSEFREQYGLEEL